MTRAVTEFPDLVKNVDKDDQGSPSKYHRINDPEDPDLVNLDAQLKKFERDYGKSSVEIADIYCKVSGRINKMKDYLDNKPNVVEWDYLEDLALTKPEDSPEF